jgi:hypothetical protein
MPQSRRYKVLVKRLEQLRHRMLPRKFSPTGDYTPVQLDRTRGYRLLAHAEIEAFLEDRASDLVNRAFNCWRTDFKPRHTITALLAFCRIGDKKYGTVLESIGAALATYNYIVRNNHGVKEDDILKFLLPCGIDKGQMDATWLATLSSFGAARGEIAHSSVRVHQPIDPRTEYDTVTNKILPGIRELDDLMAKIR